MGGTERATALNVERRRGTITLRRPEILSALAGAGIEGDSEEGRAAQVWAASILKARDAWADVNRQGRRYSDREAAGPLVRRAPHPNKGF